MRHEYERVGPESRAGYEENWAAGKVLAANDVAAGIELERVTSNGDTLVSTW